MNKATKLLQIIALLLIAYVVVEDKLRSDPVLSGMVFSPSDNSINSNSSKDNNYPPNTSFIEKRIINIINGIASSKEGKEAINALSEGLKVAKSCNVAESDYVRALPFNYEVINKGRGNNKAKCSDKVMLNITEGKQSTLVEGSLYELDLEHEVIASIFGMKEGETRTITKDGREIRIDLRKLNSDLAKTSDLNLQIFNNIIGKGNIAICADKVDIVYDLYNHQGKLIKENAKLTDYKIGKKIDGSSIFAEILIGMRDGGSRMAIIPPGHFGNDIAILNLSMQKLER